jgi:hypothetical protein
MARDERARAAPAERLDMTRHASGVASGFRPRWGHVFNPGAGSASEVSGLVGSTVCHHPAVGNFEMALPAFGGWRAIEFTMDHVFDAGSVTTPCGSAHLFATSDGAPYRVTVPRTLDWLFGPWELPAEFETDRYVFASLDGSSDFELDMPIWSFRRLADDSLRHELVFTALNPFKSLHYVAGETVDTVRVHAFDGGIYTGTSRTSCPPTISSSGCRGTTSSRFRSDR